MAGYKGRQGRKPKLATKHKLDGTYRADRHASRLESVAFGSAPLRLNPPETLRQDGKQQWQAVLDTLPSNVLKNCDEGKLYQLAFIRQQLNDVQSALQSSPVDVTLINTYIKLSGQYDRLARQFGLSPIDRAAMKVEEPQKDADPFAEFMKAELN
jgi:phage terminase small subunit